MSDFDKEAEREKLREKYGDDADDRAATEQMSELLLKGATMTNAHCNNCGDPIFRYDDQEFCPTCQQPVDRGDADGAADSEPNEDNIEMTTPSDDATVQFGDQSGTSDDSEPSAQAHGRGSTAEPPATDDSPADVEQSHVAPSVDPATTDTASSSSVDQSAVPPSDPTRQRGETAASDHLANAQTLLAQTIETYAQRARDADSPRQAQAYLEAAREAAATLDETGF